MREGGKVSRDKEEAMREVRKVRKRRGSNERRKGGEGS